MGLLDLFRSSWKHSNPEIRKQAILQLKDQQILLRIIKQDKNLEVQLDALNNLLEVDLLTDIAENSPIDSLREQAQERLKLPKVSFVRTGRNFVWDNRYLSVLEMMIDFGVPVYFGCRRGTDGICVTRLFSGEIKYSYGRPKKKIKDNMCLPCIAVPVTDISLNC